MKAKTIKKILDSKFNEWLQTIKDPFVNELVKKNSIITGGCIASMLLNEKVNDYDVYFTNKETTKAVAEYYVKQWNEANNDNGYVLDGAIKNDRNPDMKGGAALNMTPDRIKVVFESDGVAAEEGAVEDISDVEDYEAKPVETDKSKPTYRPIYLSSNAITLSNSIQIVLRFYGEADNIHQHYDYVHCTNYWLSNTKAITLKQPALEALLAKELIYIGSKYPLASIVRTRKFIRRGWQINAGQYLKMAFQISKLDLTNVEVLEDQLTGVDVAYFNILVDAIQRQKENATTEGKEFSVDYPYIAAIIDRIF